MNIYRYPLSASLPLLIFLACAIFGSLIISHFYKISRQDVIDDEKSIAVTLASITASQIEYQLRQNDRHAARTTMDRLKNDRNFMIALLLDDKNRIMFSTNSYLAGRSLSDLDEFFVTAVEQSGTNGLLPVVTFSPGALSTLVMTPVYLSPGENELSSTRRGTLIVQRDLAQPLSQRQTAFRNGIIGVIGSILALSIGLWLLLRKLLFDRMNILLSGLKSEEEVFRPTAVLDGSDELSRIAHGFERFTKSLKQTRDLRAATEQQFRTIFEQSAVGIARVAMDGTWLQVNDKLCHILGYNRNELINLRFQDITHPDDLVKDIDLLEKLQNREIHEYSLEKRYIARDDATVWAHLSVSAVQDAGGHIEHYIAIIQDISDTVSIKQRLVRAQEVAQVGSWQGDMRDGSLEWSSQVYRIFGIEQGGFAGTQAAFFELVHPEDRVPLQRAVEEWLDTGEPLDHIHRIMHADGELRWVREQAQFNDDPRDQPYYTFGTVQDVTSMVLAEQELKRERLLLASILESAPIGIVACNAEGVITSFNRVARLWHQLDALPLSGDHWAKVYSLFQKDGVTPLEPHEVPLMRAYQGEAVRDFEMVIAPRNGPVRTVLSSAEPVVDRDDHRLGAIVAMLDITERKRAEEDLRNSHLELEDRVKERTESLQKANARLMELDQLKSLFIASMSHELRTPLNSIIGFTGMLLQEIPGPVNDKQHDYLTRVAGSGRHLLGLITDVIDIAKLEAGKAHVHIEKFDLSALIGEAVSQFRVQVENKGLGLRTKVPEGIFITSDQRKVLQCILNYLSNAMKYTPQGEIVIELNVSPDAGYAVEIAVTDTGIGIAADAQERLFQQFSRIDSEITRNTTGTGLGLYLNSKLATELLGGKVAVSSTPGKGSTFYLYLPEAITL